MFRRKRRRSKPAEAAAQTPAATPLDTGEVSQVQEGPTFAIRWSVVGLVLLLIVIIVFALALNNGLLPDVVVTYWPAIVMIPALLWLIVSLLGRDVRGLMGSTALFGLSISLLFAAQGIPLSTTLVGVMFIAFGIGIMLRGLLLRHLPISE